MKPPCEEKHYSKLSELVEIQKKISGISPLFSNHYPVATVTNNTFHIYDMLSDKIEYVYVKSAPCPFPIPEGVMAAFPLDCYEDKISAVISPKTFESLEGYAFILHEFVHCAQYVECEMELKRQLRIAQEYKKKNDYMWEINHPFPYQDESFANLYANLLQADSLSEVSQIRMQLRNRLNSLDWEYMLWQEWKEGYARFWENKIREQLGIEENHFGLEAPLSRISFYEGGSRLISLFERAKPDAVHDMRALFHEMGNL